MPYILKADLHVYHVCNLRAQCASGTVGRVLDLGSKGH